MKCIRTLVAAVAAVPVTLLLSLAGAGTAPAETINCPNVNPDLVDCQVKVNVTGGGGARLCATVEVLGQRTDGDCIRFHVP